MGLAISKRVVELMGGSISVESTPGEGSRFVFELPFVAPKQGAAQDVRQTRPAGPAQAFTHYRLLVAEDDPVNRLVAVRMLENLGCDVKAVSNGREALEAIEKEEFNLVFMDCRMPEIDGFEATRRLRAREKGRHVPVIALTANAFRGDREECLAASMDEYISKPFRKQDLAQVLHRFLDAPVS